MSEKSEIKRGTKIEADELGSIDHSKIAIMTTMPPPSDDVQGQWRYDGYTQCPWCGNVGFTRGLQTQYYVAVYCGACGRPFRA